MPDETETRIAEPDPLPYEAPGVTVIGTVEDLTGSFQPSLTP